MSLPWTLNWKIMDFLPGVHKKSQSALSCKIRDIIMFFMQFKTIYDFNDKIKRSRFDVFSTLKIFHFTFLKEILICMLNKLMRLIKNELSVDNEEDKKHLFPNRNPKLKTFIKTMSRLTQKYSMVSDQGLSFQS